MARHSRIQHKLDRQKDVGRKYLHYLQVSLLALPELLEEESNLLGYDTDAERYVVAQDFIIGRRLEGLLSSDEPASCSDDSRR